MTKRDEISNKEINRLMTDEIKKRQKLRNNEYYDTQEMFDDLYHKSKRNYKFYKLMDLITNKQNIELAYRNIKKNTGSRTGGTNTKTIDDVADKSNGNLVEYVKRRLQNYHPHEVRRVEIPKDNGKTRPLGIPTIEDRIIQQCIKQVLEPICEAKFYNHSYGFRPNRSTEHAIARSYFLMQKNNLHYVVDIDIKGFFDNVDHGKLLKQMWSLGIQDKQLLCVISKMLKAPIEGIGVPVKGTPQGGILSPLLSNIVLNELDWWIANQWEYFKTEHNYKVNRDKNRQLRVSTQLKEIFIVRYADDFKIFCRNHDTANRIFQAIKMWLKERLYLDISEEKSKIVNLKTNYSEFLGFKMKVHDKGKKKVVKSHITDKARNKVIESIKLKIDQIYINSTIENVNKYNATILGQHNYYKLATNVSKDFNDISFKVKNNLYNKTKNLRSKQGLKTRCYNKFYGQCKGKTVYILGVALFPIWGIRTKPPMSFSQDICDYTTEGRNKIHQKLKGITSYMLKYLMENPIASESVEYNDNRISLYVGQNGICPITEMRLEIGNMECHHKTPKSLGGSDKYQNLIFLKTEVHRLIHATTRNTIAKYMNILKLDNNALNQVNKLRILVGNFEIA